MMNFPYKLFTLVKRSPDLLTKGQHFVSLLCLLSITGLRTFQFQCYYYYHFTEFIWPMLLAYPGGCWFCGVYRLLVSLRQGIKTAQTSLSLTGHVTWWCPLPRPPVAVATPQTWAEWGAELGAAPGACLWSWPPETEAQHSDSRDRWQYRVIWSPKHY